LPAGVGREKPARLGDRSIAGFRRRADPAIRAKAYLGSPLRSAITASSPPSTSPASRMYTDDPSAPDTAMLGTRAATRPIAGPRELPPESPAHRRAADRAVGEVERRDDHPDLILVGVFPRAEQGVESGLGFERDPVAEAGK